MFTTHGLPVTITSDNGPQFVSEEFRLLMNTNNIQHIRTTPLWSQANGEVERQNRTLLKAIRIAPAEGRDWRKELRTFFLHTEGRHIRQQVSVRLNFCSRERSAQNFRNLILLSKQIDEAVRDRDRAQRERRKLCTDRKTLH